MSLTVNSQQQTNSNKPSLLRRACATGAALVVSSSVKNMTPAFGTPIAKSWWKLNNNASKAEIQALNQASDKVLNQLTNLSKKGVEIIDGAKLEKQKGTIFGNVLNSVIDGKNSYFSLERKMPKWVTNLNDAMKKESKTDFLKDVVGLDVLKPNKVYTNREKMPFVLLHELGHADGFNNSKFIKNMAKSRGFCQLAAGLLPIIAACTKKEVTLEGEELTKKQKVKNALRNALPLASVALMLPTLLDEGIASIKANKWAKKLLNPQMASKVAKSNRIGCASYAVVAAMASIATHAALKIKDAVVQAPNFTSVKNCKPSMNAHQG